MIRLLLAFLLVPCALFGASSRAELIFNIQSAIKTQNSAALAQCFNFDGADDTTRKAYARVIKNMCTWPNPIVQTSERDGTGQLKMMKDGRPYISMATGRFRYTSTPTPTKSRDLFSLRGRCAEIITYC